MNQSPDVTRSSDAANEPKQYWCHVCNGEVQVTIAEDQEVVCNACNNTFVEERDPQDDPSTFLAGAAASNTTNAIGGQNQGNPAVPTQLNAILQSLVGQISGQTPSNVEIYVHGNQLSGMLDGGGLLGMAGNPGDYVVGNGALENLLNTLLQADSNNGPPPASKKVVAELPELTITEEHVAEGKDCAVCKDTFSEGETVCQLPCAHVYHKACVRPWLEKHNTCPVCRHELPTDDSEYERRKEQRQLDATASN